MTQNAFSLPWVLVTFLLHFSIIRSSTLSAIATTCGAESALAKYLADSCGPSMSYLHSEIKKLAVLYGEGEKITKELINNVCVKSMQGIIFDLTDAIGNKDRAKSLKMLEELILKKEAEQFINYLASVDAAYKNADYIGYSTPIQAAKAKLPLDIQNDLAGYPSASILQKTEVFDDLASVVAKYDRIWTEIKAAH